MFFYDGQTFANINFQNELALGVANSAQIDENLGGKFFFFLSDCNWTRTHNHLVRKRLWLWLWVQVQLQSLKKKQLHISHLFQARSS